MKNIAVNFEDISQEVLEAIAKQFPKGFVESDIVSFSHFDNSLEDRIRVIVGGAVYLVKKSLLEDLEAAKYEAGYFKTLNTEEPNSDLDA